VIHALVDDWQRAVRTHLVEYPPSEAEWRRLIEQAGSAGRAAVEDNPLQIYGATLLAVLASQEFMFLAQIGDGDVLLVSAVSPRMESPSDPGPWTSSLAETRLPPCACLMRVRKREL
jgi:hypothetical protein